MPYYCRACDRLRESGRSGGTDLPDDGSAWFLHGLQAAGGSSALGIGISASPERFKKMQELEKYFTPWGNFRISEGGGGVDIGPLRKLGTPLSTLIPDPQRYFDYHHSANDTFEQINIRELQLGSAAITSLVWLVDLFDL